MKTSRTLTLLLLLFTSVLPAAAQQFELGKVTKTELQQKMHPADTSAPAAILFKIGRSYFEITSDRFYLVTEVEARIKIYKKTGYAYANQEVPYYSGGAGHKVYFSDAYTYNLAGGEIEKIPVKSDGEFEEKINENVSVKKIVLPNVKEGSVIEYKYTVKSPYLHNVPDWYFQYSIPANFVSYEFATPPIYEYNRYLSGYIPVEITQPVSRRALGDNFMETAVTYTARNVKAVKDESYVNNIRNYMSILKLEYAAYKPQTSGGGSGYTATQARPVYYTTTWEDMSKKIYDDKDFGKQIRATSYFEDDIKALIPAGLSNDEKMMKIFNYVKSRMNWNEKESYFTDKGVAKAYKEKVGNVADINLMLTGMLRYADLEANPVLISTRANGVALYPNLTAYDYVIAAVKTETGYILLDATSKYALPDVLPVRTINWEGRMIRENGTNIKIDLNPKVVSKEVINISASMDKEGKLTGRIRDQRFDYNALVFREKYVNVNRDNYIEKLEGNIKGIHINEYTLTNEKDLSKPVVEDFTFTHSGIADVTGDKIYFNPMLFYAHTVNPFMEETREYPIDFVYPQQDKYMINITIPEGYVVESLPKPIALAMEQNIGSFKYNIASQNNQIQVIVSLDINYPSISQDYYNTIKDFFKKMVEKQTEKVVLKKA
jgi:hypothetical protein